MGEKQYLELLDKILKEGDIQESRNGKTQVLFGEIMRFSLNDNKIPLITTKKLAWKTCLKELLWFISGSTNNNILKEQNVNIWNDNAEEYKERMYNLRSHSIHDGDLGPIYSHQWRHFNAEYSNCNIDYTNKGIDQLQDIINKLKHPTERFSRRLIMSAWNPCQIDEMALPPCHVMCQFHVSKNNRLHCSLYQRSGDMGLGVPFNIASYSFLTHIIARICDLEAYEFVHFIGNAHIYLEHRDALREQIIREPFPTPHISIDKLDNIDDYKVENIQIQHYEYHKKIFMDMKV